MGVGYSVYRQCNTWLKLGRGLVIDAPLTPFRSKGRLPDENWEIHREC